MTNHERSSSYSRRMSFDHAWFCAWVSRAINLTRMDVLDVDYDVRSRVRARARRVDVTPSLRAFFTMMMMTTTMMSPTVVRANVRVYARALRVSCFVRRRRVRSSRASRVRAPMEDEDVTMCSTQSQGGPGRINSATDDGCVAMMITKMTGCAT